MKKENITRRAVLAAVGTGASASTSVFASTAGGREDSGEEATHVVRTGRAMDVTEAGATLHGRLVDMAGHDELHINFAIREAYSPDDSFPVAAEIGTLDSRGPFSATIPTDDGYPSGFFESDTAYEYRASAIPQRGEPVYLGQIQTFPTAPACEAIVNKDEVDDECDANAREYRDAADYLGSNVDLYDVLGVPRDPDVAATSISVDRIVDDRFVVYLVFHGRPAPKDEEGDEPGGDVGVAHGGVFSSVDRSMSAAVTNEMTEHVVDVCEHLPDDATVVVTDDLFVVVERKTTERSDLRPDDE